MATRRLELEQWERILPLLDRVLELTGAPREAFLATLDGAQPDVARALRLLLEEQTDLEAQHFLENPPATLRPEESMRGRDVGNYTIESLIGRGGMGEVWLAQRNDGRFDRKVAVKLINASLLSRDAHERFEQEGRLLARLTHPNIAPLLDAGVTAENRPYIVLEYVAGEPIDRYCDERSLGIDARLRLFLNVLAAVIHAQNHLVVHRDLKPTNVLVTHDGVVKLLDFGIAKLLGNGAATDAEVATRLGEFALTPEFAAPEQIFGETVSTATDVYQLGVLLHLLLTGIHPYAQAAASRRELARIALETVPSRMSDTVARPGVGESDFAATRAHRRSTSTAGLRAALRGDLDAIVAKSLRKDANARYGSASSLAEDLRHYLAHEPVAAREGAFRYRAGKFMRRYRGTLLSTSAGALALIATTVLTLMQTYEAWIQRDEARFQAKRADAERRFMTLLMSEIGADGRPSSLEEVVDHGLELLDKQYADEPAFVVAMLIGLSGRYMDLGNTRKEHAALVKAEGIARKLGPSYLASVQCNTVETEIALGDLRAAATRLEEGRSALARVAKPDFKQSVNCLRAQGSLDEVQGKFADAIRHVEQAVSVLEQNDDTQGIQYAALLSQLDRMYWSSGSFRKALEVNHRRQAGHEQAGRGRTVAMRAALYSEARSLAAAGQIRDALARQRIASANLGTTPLHPNVSRQQGELLLRMGDPAEALRWLDISLQSLRGQGATSSQIMVRASRSQALLTLGRSAEALAEFPDLSVLEGASDSASHQALVHAQIAWASVRLTQGETEAAAKEIDRVLVETRAASDVAPWKPRALVLAARVAQANGRTEEAVRRATEALQVSRLHALEPEHSADVGESLLILAAAQRSAGDERATQSSARQAHAALQYALGPAHSLTRSAATMTDAPEPR